MATVFLAQDLRHKRPVALKVLHAELAHTLGPERFEREIETVARLQHPHILTVFDSGETSGHLWFTMPYVAGESLRDRLRRERQLPLEDALRITTESARALDYAHREGFIHRDIKPENILLTRDGDTLVTDFGISRALGAPAAGEKLTETGFVVGTAAYMSPEQAAGEQSLDGRTDVYSLGVVLYEMIAGEAPFTGPTPQAILARTMTESPRPLRLIRETVPEQVEQAVARALARAPADRFHSAAEFAQALKPAPASPSATQTTVVAAWPRTGPLVVAAVMLLLLVGGIFTWRRAHSPTPMPANEPKRLAVLPFDNLGPAQDEYFADGVVDAVRGKLAAVPGLQVTASSSSGQYKHTAKTPREVGQELGVDYLLMGKVRWQKLQAGDSRVEVSPELVQASTATTVWQEPFEAAITDVFQVQADVARRVAQSLDVALGAGERARLAEKPTGNLAAYDLYLQGNEAANGFDLVAPVELRRAAGFYERAVALDSTFALAWAALSRSHSLIYYLGTPTSAEAEAARRTAERARMLAPGLADVHLALADYDNFVRKNWESALVEYAAGRRLAPSNADLLKGMALVARSQGRWDESLGALRQALVLDPRSTATARRLGYTLLFLQRYRDADAAADQALKLNPHDPALYEHKVMARLGAGDLAGARAVLDSARTQVEPTALVSWIATYYDLFWVLDEDQQRLLLREPPSLFGDDRLLWGLALCGASALRGEMNRARVYADSARIAGEAQVREAPDDGYVRVLLGTALAYLGRKGEAIREGERAVRLLPITKDANRGAYVQHQLVRIYLLVGEPERALDQLEPLVLHTYYLSPAWLTIDPTFAPLRGNPRFERLVHGASRPS
jgi:serine/threonine-protein kinase